MDFEEKTKEIITSELPSPGKHLLKDKWPIREGEGTLPGICFRAIWMVYHPPAGPQRSMGTHAWHELICMCEGGYRIRLEDGVRVLQPGEWMLIPQGTLHQAIPDNQCRLYALQWEGESGAPEGVLQQDDPSGRVLDQLNWIWRTWMNRSEGTAACLDAHVLALILGLQLEGGSHESWISEVELFIRDYRAPQLAMKELERVFAKSARHITREFDKAYGCPPMEYYRKIRAERAVRYLRNSWKPIAELSEHMGYQNSSAMARDLKQRTGLTPTQIRNQGKGM